jgi:hypothetical protein
MKRRDFVTPLSAVGNWRDRERRGGTLEPSALAATYPPNVGAGHTLGATLACDADYTAGKQASSSF